MSDTTAAVDIDHQDHELETAPPPASTRVPHWIGDPFGDQRPEARYCLSCNGVTPTVDVPEDGERIQALEQRLRVLDGGLRYEREARSRRSDDQRKIAFGIWIGAMAVAYLIILTSNRRRR